MIVSTFQRLYSRIRQIDWLILSLAVSAYFGLISLHYAFSEPYIVQDDARIHLVWLQQFIDPQLFPHDLFANYYQAIQPIGFKGFYWTIAQLGIEPLLLAKFLPIVLSLLTTIYSFYLSLKFLPVPSSAFLSALILNQNIWLKDDLISATPRSFNYLLLAAFLYYLLNRSLIPCLMTLILQGLFYPQLMLVEVGVLMLRCLHWQGRSLKLLKDRHNYTFALSGLAISLVIILLFSTGVTQEFGSLVTAEQMQTMPEFGVNGRREYFGVEPIRFWFGGASGLRLPLFPPIIWMSAGLLFLHKVNRSRLTSIVHINLLFQLAVSSLSLFILAHGLFPALYLPSRYTFYSFRMIMSIGAGIVLFVLIHRGWHWLQIKQKRRQKLNFKQQLLVGFCGIFAVLVFVIPAIPALLIDCQNWIVGDTPGLYQFLQRQPKSSLVASLALEANNIPTFAQRSVFVSQELALPYHSTFYRQVQARMSDLIRAQYSQNLSETQAILQKYQIDFLLIETQSFEPSYLLQQDWLMHSSVNAVVRQAVAQLQQGKLPALSQAIDRCEVFREGKLIVLDAGCIQSIPLSS